MNDRELARALSYARLSAGAALLAAPQLATRVWTGETATSGMKLQARSVGARDLALAAGTLRTLARGESPSAWLAASAAADAGDALGILSAFRSLSPARRMLFLATAGGAAALGARLSGRMR